MKYEQYRYEEQLVRENLAFEDFIVNHESKKPSGKRLCSINE